MDSGSITSEPEFGSDWSRAQTDQSNGYDLGHGETATKAADQYPELQEIGEGRFFSDPKKILTDLSLIDRYAANAKWTDDELAAAHHNVALLTTCSDPELSLKAYGHMQKTVTEHAKIQIQRAKLAHELAKPQKGPDGHIGSYHNHLHIGDHGSSDDNDRSEIRRIEQIAEQLGISITAEVDAPAEA